MIPNVKLMLVLATVLGVLLINIHTMGKKSGNQKSVKSNSGAAQLKNADQEAQLRNAAQKALDAIGVNRNVTASYDRAVRGQHVFNNALNKFHYKVLKKLLEQVNGPELEKLKQDLTIPLSQAVQDAIETWVVSFSLGEFYVDFNANVFGDYVSQLRSALVEYLKADACPDQEKHLQHVQFLADAMVNHNVYVDPMASDRWLNRIPKKKKKLYDQVKHELSEMFQIQNILQAFKKVYDKIHDFHRNNQNQDRDLK